MGLLQQLHGLLRRPAPVTAAPPQPASAGLAPRAPSASPAEEAEAARRAGNAALEAGRLDAARNAYRRFADLQPENPLAHLNLGFALQSAGQFGEAEGALKRALALAPDHHEVHFFLGQNHLLTGQPGPALVAFSRCVSLAPAFGPAWRQLGQLREQQGAAGQAVQCYQRAAEASPEDAEAWQGLARVALSDRQYEAALAALARWRALEPEAGLALGMQADALRRLERVEEALVAAEAAATRMPGDAVVQQVLGWCLHDSRRHADGLRAFDRALALQPTDTASLAGRVACLLQLDRAEEALAACEVLRRQAPDHADLAHDHALCLLQLRRVDEAVDVLQGALVRQPDEARLHLALATALLARGDYAPGWQEYEWRHAVLRKGRPALPVHPPLWTGETPLAGLRLLVTSEQGLGDTLQFLRYVPHLLEAGARVTLYVSPRLGRLVDGRWPGCTVITQRADAPSDLDAQCSLLSLPALLRRGPPAFPAQPYLSADASRRAHWAAELGPRRVFTVGLAWAGNPNYVDDARRSIPLELLRRQAADGLRFISLQFDLRERDRPALADWPGGLYHAGAQQQDMADTAALMQEVDAVLSVDTALAHLAGACGRPLILLLPYAADWRWGVDGTRTPWYPSAYLARQDASRRWEPAIADAMAQLQAMARAHTA